MKKQFLASPSECGRPLGIRHYKDEKFLSADCYKGILEVDFVTGLESQKTNQFSIMQILGKVTTLLSSDTIVDGKRLLFPDDLDFIDEDTIIFSDASTTWDLVKFSNAIMELKGDGR